MKITEMTNLRDSYISYHVSILPFHNPWKTYFFFHYAWTHIYTVYCLHTSLSYRRVSRIWSQFFFIDHNYFLEAQRNVINLLLFLYKERRKIIKTSVKRLDVDTNGRGLYPGSRCFHAPRSFLRKWIWRNVTQTNTQYFVTVRTRYIRSLSASF